MEPKYICLPNPHSGEWLVFDYVHGREKYAPHYGCPLTSGETPEDAIHDAESIFGVAPDEVEVCY